MTLFAALAALALAGRAHADEIMPLDTGPIDLVGEPTPLEAAEADALTPGDPLLADAHEPVDSTAVTGDLADGWSALVPDDAATSESQTNAAAETEPSAVSEPPAAEPSGVDPTADAIPELVAPAEEIAAEVNPEAVRSRSASQGRP